MDNIIKVDKGVDKGNDDKTGYALVLGNGKNRKYYPIDEAVMLFITNQERRITGLLSGIKEINEKITNLEKVI